MKNEKTGARISAPEGFSWTTLFFGAFPALFRGDFVGVIIYIFLMFVTFGVSWLIMPFLYNGMYIRRLEERGFKTY